jgi:Flp pilus assembly protein TadD
MNLLAEMKRRKVFPVTIAYAVLAWLRRTSDVPRSSREYHLNALTAHIRLGQEAEAFEELLRAVALSPGEAVTATELRSVFTREGLTGAVAAALRRSLPRR